MYSGVPIFPDGLLLFGLALMAIAVAMAWKGVRRWF